MRQDPLAEAPERPRPTLGLMRLVYVSFAARQLSSEDLADIEARSQLHNLAAGITGLLIAQGQFFYGVVEGHRRRVLARMEVIITDERHCGLRILLEETVCVRRFANWSFARLPEGAIGKPDAAAPGRFIVELSRRLALTFLFGLSSRQHFAVLTTFHPWVD